MNEDVPPPKHGDFPASHVSFRGCKWVDGLQCIAYMFLFFPKMLIDPVLITISPEHFLLQMRDATQTF